MEDSKIGCHILYRAMASFKPTKTFQYGACFRRIPNIRFIVDFDGFFIGGQFIAKELGVCDTEVNSVAVYHFKTAHVQAQCTLADRKTVKYVTNFVHGLDISDDRAGDLEQKNIDPLLKRLSEEAGEDFIAYKGGHVEHDYLTKIGSKNILNLEIMEVPKFERIISEYPHFRTIENGYTCKRHNTLRDPRKKAHCASAEVKIFQMFLMNRTTMGDH